MRLRRLLSLSSALVIVLLVTTGTGVAAPRDVQVRSVDFGTGIIELHNFGGSNEPLDGWQLCTFDDDESFRYSSSSGLLNVSIDPGASLFIHTLDDAPADPSRINLSTIGGFTALPIDSGPYVLTLYGAGGGFTSPSRVVDHVMWNLGGAAGPSNGRAGVAVSAGLWTDANSWVNSSGAGAIFLQDTQGGLLHGPSDYGDSPPIAVAPTLSEFAAIATLLLLAAVGVMGLSRRRAALA